MKIPVNVNSNDKVWRNELHVMTFAIMTNETNTEQIQEKTSYTQQKDYKIATVSIFWCV